ncbi:MAG: PTS sugar transporter subunit IIA [Anaerostipes sp.]|nr:PTS sugar transporter subunit IIA [Anaerostipes sp.]
MKVYKQEQVRESLPGIVLLSHGPFAVVLVETAKMVFGESENVAAFSFEEGDDVDEYRKTVVETLETFPEGSIVMLDLFGGSPCNQMLRYVQETEKVLEIVSGMNLPMLVNAFLAREGVSGTELSLDAVSSGTEGIRRVDVEGFLEDDDEDE